MLKIVIDTREQTPWYFPEELAEVTRSKLDAGDYALLNDNNFAIERKSLNDFVGTVSSGWERFKEELQRMINFPSRIIIVESNISDIIKHNYNHPKVLPKFVFKRTSMMMVRGVNVIFVDNPATASGFCYTLLLERSLHVSNDR